MKKILRGRILLASIICAVVVFSGVSAGILASGIFMYGKDIATQGSFHLYCNPLQLCIVDGKAIVCDECLGITTERAIYGNLFTFTHPSTPNQAKITEWTFDFKPPPVSNPEPPPQAFLKDNGTMSGSFTIGVNLPDESFGETIGKVYITWNAHYEFVPPLYVGEPMHYNFEGPFKIEGGTGFYEGIQGEGTIGGTYHRHPWHDNPLNPNDQKAKFPWFDFAMIGKAKFPGNFAMHKPLNIACLSPITGPAAEKGSAIYHGQQDYIRYINDSGGINGHPINAIFYDDEYNDIVAQQIYDQVSDSVLLMTSSSSKITVALESRFNSDEMPFISAYSTASLLQPPEHAYATLPTYRDGFAAFVEWLYEEGMTGMTPPVKIAMYGLNNQTGFDAYHGALKVAENDPTNIDILGPWYHTATVTYLEATATLNAILAQDPNPDWIYISSTPSPAATIVEAARDIPSLAGTNICLGQAGGNQAFIWAAGSDANGVYAMQTTNGWGTDVPGMAKAIEYAQTYHPEDIGKLDYLEGWQLGMCTAEALRNTLTSVNYNDLTPQMVEEYGLSQVSFAAGELTSWVDWTDENDRRGAKALHLAQVQDEEWVLLLDGEWIEAPLLP
ncbi:ABC transporter substrate-binding protein [Chloroflexota bacterium]